ncbi:hypothetical protein WMF27_00345 [Sorangium sp. So ce281]|uniref:hypothetical protein n=1 Tax=Sorangium sp. So ce281 TaxID=3133293 RepID=UPI003F60A6CA
MVELAVVELVALPPPVPVVLLVVELADLLAGSWVLAVQAGALGTCHERQERDGTERGGSLRARSSIC